MPSKADALLWRFEREDAPGPSFLFGAMHVRDNRAFAHLDGVYAAIEQCEAFAAEYHLGESEPQYLNDALQLPEGQTLPGLLGDRRYARLRRSMLKMSGIDLDQMPNIVPFALLNMADYSEFASDHEFSLDEHLWHFAAERAKEMRGLETFGEQIQVLQNIPLDHQVKALLDLSRHMPRHRRQMERLTRMYVEGNIRQLYQSSRKGLGKLRKPLLFERNRIMARRWDALARHTTLFAAVGAAHLGGGHGMIRLIKKMGWKAKAVFYSYK